MSKRSWASMRMVAAFLVGAIGTSCEHATNDHSDHAAHPGSDKDILGRAANELREKSRWTARTGTVIVARVRSVDSEAVHLIEAEPGAGVQVWPRTSSDAEGPICARSGVMRINGSRLEIALAEATCKFFSATAETDRLVLTLGNVNEL
jgi:hypothetical protein